MATEMRVDSSTIRIVTQDGILVHVVTEELIASTMTVCGHRFNAGLGWPRVWTLRAGADDGVVICEQCRKSIEQ